MIGLFERMTALRYLGSRRREGFVSVIALFSFLGIVLGVGTLIVVMSVMTGFREELLGRIVGVNGHALIAPVRGEVALSDYDRIAAGVGLVNGVVSATPYVEGQVLASSPRNGRGALLRGVRPTDFKSRAIFMEEDSMVSGLLEDFGRRPGVFVGDKLANSLGLWIGDPITLLSPRGPATLVGTVPVSKTYEIVGVFNVGMFEYDSSFIFMPFDEAQLFLYLENAATAVEVFVGDPAAIEQYRAPLATAAGGDVRVIDWKLSNRSFVNALEIERNVMFLILTLIILVAAFNIVSGMIMLVKDKGRDIAILRTMGASRGMILRVFLIAGASIGVMGTMIGGVAGVLFADNIAEIQAFLESLLDVDLFPPEVRFLSQVPAKIDWMEVAMISAMSLALSFLSTIYPAWRAARLDPVEALRYE